MSLGRNFEWRVPPTAEQRGGRYVNDTGGELRIGTPVAIDTAKSEDSMGLQPVKQSSGTTDTPEPGRAGVMVYEHLFVPGDILDTFSDKDTAPDGAAVQVVSGPSVEFVLKNTEDRTFLNSRSYSGVTMVAGLGATLTLAVGDYLRPHDNPSDSNGYWQETSTASEAWAVVTHVDNDRSEVQARLLF